MKRTILFPVFMTLLMASISVVQGQRADFSGMWKIDRTKTTVSTDWPVLVRIRIDFKGDTLLTERFYDTGDGQEYPFTEKLSLDSKEYSMIIYDMPRKIKASFSDKEELLNFESTTTFNGSAGTEDFISKETWKVDKAAGVLTIGFNNKLTAGEFTGAFVFTKE